MQEHSVAIEEWNQIRKLSRPEILQLGQKWLTKHCSRAIAGEVLIHLINMKPSTRLARRARTWLQKYPDHKSTPGLLAVLLRTESSVALFGLARSQLLDAETNYFKGANSDREILRGTASLMREVLTHYPRSKLFDLVEHYLNEYPDAAIWHRVFPIVTYDNPNRRAEKLTILWMQSNVKNPKLETMCPPVLTPCPEVRQVCFNWVLAVGAKSSQTPLTLGHILLTSRPDDVFLSDVIHFSRNWLKTNPENNYVGNLYAQLIGATQSSDDIRNAKKWHKSHVKSRSAGVVVASLLEIAHLTSSPPDTEIVSNVVF